MGRAVTVVIWIVSAVLCVAASAAVTFGAWLANREHEECDIWAVPIFFVVTGVLVFVVSSLACNRRMTGRWCQVTLGWLLLCNVFIAVGIVGCLQVTDWLERTVAEGIVRSVELQP